MKGTKKIVALFLALIAMLGCLSACGGGDANVDEGGSDAVRDELNYGLPQEPGKLDPQNDSLLVTRLTNRQIFDTLFITNAETREIEPNLATEWNWEDDVTLNVTLRDDVTFHNGEKLTAEDVAYTISRCTTGNASATLYASFDAENTVVIDDTHLTIKFKEPYASAINVLASAMSGIVCKSYAESVDETTFARNPIGTGAFKFVEWVSGDHITLVRNDDYWGYKASYTTLNLRIINDNSARAIELETGGIDMTDTLNDADVVRFESTEGLVVHKVPSTKINYLTFNEDNPILANETVRRAIAHAIDAEAVVKAAYGTGGIVATSSMASTIFGYKNVGTYEYNPELAKQLLAEAGYADGFSMVIVCPNVATNIKSAETIQTFLSAVNIDMQIEQYDAATWKGTKLREASTDTAIYNLTVDTFDPDQNYMALYASSGYTTISTKDATVNELLAKGRSETDTEKRKAIYAELQDYIYEHVIEVPTVETVVNYSTKDYIKNFTPDVGLAPELKYVTFD